MSRTFLITFLKQCMQKEGMRFHKYPGKVRMQDLEKMNPVEALVEHRNAKYGTKEWTWLNPATKQGIVSRCVIYAITEIYDEGIKTPGRTPIKNRIEKRKKTYLRRIYATYVHLCLTSKGFRKRAYVTTWDDIAKKRFNILKHATKPFYEGDYEKAFFHLKKFYTPSYKIIGEKPDLKKVVRFKLTTHGKELTKHITQKKYF